MARPTSVEELLRHTAVRQFFKFCIIGLSSTILDVAISGFLTFRVHWVWYLAQMFSFVISVTNGYIWNSVWTFRGTRSGKQHEQYLKFIAVNIVGLLLNLTLMSLVIFAFTGDLSQSHKPNIGQWGIAKAVAVVCASMWNFIASKLWTFRPPATAA